MRKKNYELVSIDIWDTIIRRRCHPDEIKVRVAQYLMLKYGKYLREQYRDIEALTVERFSSEQHIGNLSKQKGFDDEYTIIDVHLWWIQKVLDIEQLGTDIQIICKELVSVEISAELEVISLDSNILSIIENYEYSNIIFISDFYMSKEVIDFFLKKVDFPIVFDDGYVSCDYLINKRSGRLFQKIHADLNISPEKHFHIGDNLISDVEIPKSLGINTLCYNNNLQERRRKENAKKFKTRFKDIKLYMNELEQLIKTNTKSSPQLNKKQQKLFNIGKKYSVLFYSFILFIIEEAITDSQDTIFYFTREGEFFKNIHEQIAQHNPILIDIPNCKLLEVSRRATFGASLNEVSLTELMRIWNMYSTQSMKALLVSLDSNISDYIEFFHVHEIDVNEKIQYPWTDSRVINLFQDERFISKLSKELFEKRQDLLKYLKNKGIDEKQDKLCIVDIGWRGTIQDNLAYILNKTQITGYYLGLQNFLNKQLNNAIKNSYGANANLSKELIHCIDFVSPLEMICNSPHGTVLRYVKDSNEIIALREIDAQENYVYDNYTKYIQQGIISSIPIISQYVKTHSLLTSDLRSYSHELLERLLTKPEVLLAESYFKLNHDESFGVGSFVDNTQNRNVPIKLILMAILFKNRRYMFWDYLKKSGWPQAWLQYYRLPFLNNRFNYRRQLELYGDKHQ
jgi:predicted HAD superfamily hydrolase